MKTKPAKAAARRATPSRQPRLRRTCLALLIASCFGSAAANPVLPQVVSGQATFAQQGNVFSITNTPNAIINWQSFSVNPGELTRFIQQSAASTVLNRITGQDPSQILGALQSNGRVFLINPNGVLFGQGARVDVNGLVASSLAISNSDFLAGKHHFAAADGSAPGAVANHGVIATPAGGQVFLLAPNVDNSGIITAPNGQVMLAAGRSVQLADAANPSLQVVLSAPADQAVNLGQVIAQGGRIGIYGALVNQRGRLSADSAVLGENGKIVLKASHTTMLEAGSSTSATGAGEGGQIELLGRRVGLTGDASVDASGQLGGGSILVGGDYRGANAAVMNAEQTHLGAGATLKADAVRRGDGGKVIVWSDGATRALGNISARGGADGGDGGFVETSGKYLDMQATVDARAPRGKTGQLLLDPTNIYIATDASAAGGAGMSAPGPGPTGSGNAGNSGNVFSETSSSTDSLLTTAALQSALAGANVTVTTNNANAAGSGFIKLVSPLGWNSGRGLTLDAAAGIALEAGINAPTGGLTLLSASGDITQTAPIAVAGMTANAAAGNIFLNHASNVIGGPVTLQAAQQVQISAAGLNIAQLTSSGDATVTATSGSITAAGNISSNGGALALRANGGAINVAGASVVNSGGGELSLDAANIGVAGALQGGGGAVLLQAGAGINTTGASTIESQGGLVDLQATNMDLQGLIKAGAGSVGLSANDGANAVLGVGAADGANTLGLSEAELRRVSTSGELTVTVAGEGSGDLAVVGNLDLRASLNAGGLNGDLTLGGLVNSLTVNAGAQVQVTDKLNLFATPFENHRLSNAGILKAGAVELRGGKMTLAGGSIEAFLVSIASVNSINVGTGGEALETLLLSGADLASLNATTLNLVVAEGGNTSDININGPLTLAGNLVLSTPGNVNAPAAVNIGDTFRLDRGTWNQTNATLPAFSARDFQVITANGARFQRVTGGNGDPSTPYVIADVYGLQGMAGMSMEHSYVLAGDIAAAGTVNWNSGAGFVPIGGAEGTGYAGQFDGANHAITALVINRAADNAVGLFGGISGAFVKDLTLAGGSVTGASRVGALVGEFGSGSVQNVQSSAVVSGLSQVGGLAGANAGTINLSRAAGAVTGDGEMVGGLVGHNVGSVFTSTASGAVSGERSVGGLVGNNSGSIQNAIARGAVSGTTVSGFAHENVGGLVGELQSSGTITNAYSSGAVGATSFSAVGGLVGFSSGSLSGGYWNTTSSGQAGDGAGATGLSGAQMRQQASFSAFDFVGEPPTWRIYEGFTEPLLKAFLTPLQADVSGAAPNKVYDGVQSHFNGSVGYTGLTGGDTGPDGTLDYLNARNVGSYALGGLWSTKYDIILPPELPELTISPRAVTVSLSGSKVYDGLLGFDGALFTINNMVSGDSLSASGSATFADRNAGIGKAVSASEVQLGGADLGNYSFDGSASGVADISKASVSIASLTGANRVYDGSTVASVSGTVSGVVGEDDVNLATGGATSTFDNKNVGTGKAVTMTGASLSGADAGNYTLVGTGGSTTADVTVRTLNANFTALDKVYDGSAAATFTSTDDRVAGDLLTLSGSASFSDKNASPEKAVTISGVTLSGTDAGNYALASTSTTGNSSAAIFARLLSVTYTGVNKIYDGGLSASFTSTDNRVAGDVLTVSGGSASFADKNVGAGKAVGISGTVLGGADAGNYQLDSGSGSTTASITPRLLSVSYGGVNKVYDGGTGAGFTVAGDDRVTGDVLTVGGSASFADKNVGTGKSVTIGGASLSGADAGNYVLDSAPGSASADITVRTLNASFIGVDKIYDGGVAATFTSTDDRVAGDALTIGGGSASFGDKNVGVGKAVTVSGVSLSGADAGNYVLANTGGSTSAAITARLLNLIYGGVDKVYDGALMANVTIGDDRVAGDQFLTAASASFGDKNVGAGKLVSISGAALSGADAANYQIANGGLGSTSAAISPRLLNVTYGGVNRVYDGSTAATFSASDDRVANDALGVVGSASFADKNVGVGKAVSIGGASLTGADAGNYTLVNTEGSATADITARTLNLSFSGGNKVYDGGVGASVTSSDDRVAGDQLSVSHSASFADKNAGADKTVTVGDVALGGADGGNYQVSYSGNLLASISQANLFLSGVTAANRVYDGTLQASVTGAALGGVIGQDQVFVSGGQGSFSDKNVGTGKLVKASGFVLGGADAGNYAIATPSVNASADITARTLQVSYSAAGKVYDGTTQASVNGVSDDRVAGDVLDFSQSASFSDKNVGVDKAVLVADVVLGGADGGNYVVALAGPVRASITPATLSLSDVSAASRVYDGSANAVVSASLAGVIGSDAVTLGGGVGNFADKNVGVGKKVAISGFRLSGADAGNYQFVPGGLSANADITQKALATWVGTTGGLWSDARNWDGGAVPDGANVLDVNLTGSGVVNYSASAGATTIRRLNGSQGLSVSGGSLTLGNAAGDQSLLSGAPGLDVSGGNLLLRGALTVDDYTQSGGAVGGAGSLNVRRSFRQGAGNLGIDGVLSIVQASGDLTFSNLSAASVSLFADAGRISQTGPVVSASLVTRAQNGIALTNAGNRVGSFTASNSGAGGVALTNVSEPGTLVLGTLSSGAGDIVIDNTGGIESHAINANGGGNVSLTAHSPIQVEGAISGADIDLSASTDIVLADGASLDASRDVSMSAGTGIALEGAARVNAGGNIDLAAGTGVTLDGSSSLTASAGSINIATASGSIVAGSGVSIRGGSVLLSAPNGTVTAPSAIFDGGALPVVNGGTSTTTPGTPLTQALNSTVNIINSISSGALNPGMAPLPLLNAKGAPGEEATDEKGGVAKKIDDVKDSKSKEQGVKRDDATKKMYCN